MGTPLGPDQRDRRQWDGDRRRRIRDRRGDRLRLARGGWLGRLVQWFTGPWTSANGLSWLRLLVLFLIVWWGALTVYSIPTSSMEPTLHGDPRFWRGDRVIVNKLAFGPRVPFSDARLFSTGVPKRWDIVVFDSPAPGKEDEVMIKRVVGLPGEAVRFTGKVLHINGDPVDPPAAVSAQLNYTGTLDLNVAEVRRRVLELARDGRIPTDLPDRPRREIDKVWVDLLALHDAALEVDPKALTRSELEAATADVSPTTLEIIETWWRRRIRDHGVARYGVWDNLDFTIVPDGHYYCLGDNGPDSYDSRMFGWVPHENLIGRAFAVVTPISRMRDLSGFTQTRSGLAILVGTCLAVVLWEVVPGFWLFSWKLRGDIAALSLQRGDHVLIDRIRYGLRIPFSQRRLLWWGDPRPGDVVCYSLSDRRGSPDYYFGEIREAEVSPETRYIVRGPGDGRERWFALRRGDIVGKARWVWWPMGRRGRVRAVREAAKDGRAESRAVESRSADSLD